jgi:hypothetical protein
MCAQVSERRLGKRSHVFDRRGQFNDEYRRRGPCRFNQAIQTHPTRSKLHNRHIRRRRELPDSRHAEHGPVRVEDECERLVGDKLQLQDVVVERLNRTPPPSIDEGPSTPAPDETSTYVPGCWMHRETRYMWRPGFWLGYQPDWVWAPSHYVWTPGGYVFVEGFWDRPFELRGLLFAPVRVAPSLLGTP